MEALTVEMQASIHKRSSERLRVFLIKAGRDEDDVMTWDRDRLMEEWALELGKEEEEFKASPASPAETDYELQRRSLEFEIRKYEEQKEKEEREERRREEKEEREERRREEEKKAQKEKEEREERRREEKEEREEKRRKEEKKEQKEREEREERRRQ